MRRHLSAAITETAPKIIPVPMCNAFSGSPRQAGLPICSAGYILCSGPMKWRACPQISRWRFCHRSALQIRAEKSLSTTAITHLFLEDNLMKIGKAAVNGIIASLILSFGMLAGPAFAELRTTTAPDALCSNGEQAT